jgi:hypothetical protein
MEKAKELGYSVDPNFVGSLTEKLANSSAAGKERD